MIDFTQVRAYATQRDIEELCDDAMRYRFCTVSVNPVWTTFCAKRLAGSGIGVNPTVGFPLGANTARIKVEEAKECVKNGATEIDMVINIGALKSGFPQFVEKEIEAVVRHVAPVPVKVILETSYLTTEEKILTCEIARNAGAAFVKTATGFGRAGSTPEDVALMRQVVGPNMGIKAAGGIRTYADAIAMITAGATRIGTSAAVSILEAVEDDY
ncbi:MAG: deoxyribose-phosphate aldolase [Candidatus Hydrogenedentota bacterium]